MQKQLLIPLLLLAGAYVGRADVVYNDPTAWLNAVTGVTTVNFEGLLPPGTGAFVGSGPGANFTYGGINFAVSPSSDGLLFVLGDGIYYPTAVVSSQASTTPFNGLVITLPAPVTALGFSFGDFYADTATITLSDGTIAQPTAVMAPYLGFFGVISPVGITFVDIETPDPAINIGSVSFGAQTPETESPLLLAIAIAGLIVGRRLKTKALQG
jgi:hypothetical protein